MKNQKSSRRVRKIKMSIPAEQWSEKLWDSLVSKIFKAKSETEIKQLLERLLSDDEKSMILKRLAVAALVRSGKSYQDISSALWLSPNTISTIKKNLLGNYKNYKSYIAFWGGPRQWDTLNIKPEKSYGGTFLELLSFVEKVFEPFFTYHGIGVTGDRDMDKYR